MTWDQRLGIPHDLFDWPDGMDANDRPWEIFSRAGRIVDLQLKPTVGIVGARTCDAYGAGIARMLARQFAEAGWVVVSGLARGIDAEAHRGALTPQDGLTVAVLGCGIDRNYPASHGALAATICERGGDIISEYGPGTEPAPWRFPARNRLVAALSDALVVVQAREQSGSLITADFAMEYGKPVFAVPNEITNSVSMGSNRLLQQGARVCLDAQDVFDYMAAAVAGREGS